MRRYTIARSKYFDTQIHFKFLSDRLVSAGSLWIELLLTNEEADNINLLFPNRCYL